MKPTQVFFPGGSVNQIPGECTIAGDVRVTPFYDVKDVMAAIRGYVADISADLGALPSRGPMSKYVLPEEGLAGSLELSWGEGFTQGLACDLSSTGRALRKTQPAAPGALARPDAGSHPAWADRYAAMRDAFTECTGGCEPMAITGSLPCIKDLQTAGFDVQTLGFGFMRTYHANDECASLKDFGLGFRVLSTIIMNMNSPEWAQKQAAAVATKVATGNTKSEGDERGAAAKKARR